MVLYLPVILLLRVVEQDLVHEEVVEVLFEDKETSNKESDVQSASARINMGATETVAGAKAAIN
jgi:hypothetical protein